MGLLDRGAGYLTRAMVRAGGRSVTYRRDSPADSVTLIAWLGRTAFARSDLAGTGASIIWGDRDYFIPVASLVLSGVAVEPQTGTGSRKYDRRGAPHFRSAGPPGEPAWRYSDAGRTRYRIHTKRVFP
jgi:hypothetical protein